MRYVCFLDEFLCEFLRVSIACMFVRFWHQDFGAMYIDSLSLPLIKMIFCFTKFGRVTSPNIFYDLLQICRLRLT